MDRLFLRPHPRLAAHLSAFGENVALGRESALAVEPSGQVHQDGEGDGNEDDIMRRSVHSFIDETELLPHGARTAARVFRSDRNARWPWRPGRL